MLKLGCAVSALLVGALPALAQEPAQTRERGASQDAGEVGEDEIVVSGELPGAVAGDIPPEQQLGPADIRSYGVSNVAELIAELAPQTSSGRGRGGGGPVVLLNGRRISNFGEIRELPSEAILRVDIFPEEVALKYGYRADQRVVNIVLRPRFRAIATQLWGSAPTAGGTATGHGDLNVLRIGGKGRVSLDIDYTGTSTLLESERDVTATSTPLFDTRGNIGAIPGGGEIDPALSALAGQPVTVAGVPASAAPSLGDFGSTANRRNFTDTGDYRSLVGPSDEVKLNAVVSRNFSDGVSATFNARLEASNRESLLGRPGVALVLPVGNPHSPFSRDVLLSRYPDGLGPLTRSSASQTAHLGLGLNGEAGKWRWTMTGNYDRDWTRGITNTGIDPAPLQALLDAGDPALNPFGALPVALLGVRPADVARSRSQVAALDLLVNGSLFALPAGDASASIRATARMRDYRSESLRGGIARESANSRDEGSTQINLDLPIASRRSGVLSAIGDLSLNGSVELENYSDFGTLVTRGYGAVWSPVAQTSFIVSFTDEEGAPSAQQLGDPTVFTPNVRVFDYVRGESADITGITGGNPALGSDGRHVFKLGFSTRPFGDKDFSLRADYTSGTIRNQIAGFPAATAAAEAAFPGRFVRDGAGRLASVDSRPVNFARSERSEFRWGFNFSVPLSSSIEKLVTRYRGEVEEARAAGKPIPPLPEVLRRRQGQGQGQGQGGPRAQGQGEPGGQGPRRFGPGAGGRGGGGGARGFGGPNGPLAGRIQFALFHTVHLKERVTIAEGLPVLDLLDGAATGGSGGQPRHEVELQAGLMKDGLGIRFSGKWQSGTEVQGGTAASPEPLRFSDLGTLNLRLFADMGQQLRLSRKHPWLRGMRVTLAIDNLFDSRMRVTDANGTTPLSYQPDLLDPMGRTIRLSVRKLFF